MSEIEAARAEMRRLLAEYTPPPLRDWTAEECAAVQQAVEATGNGAHDGAVSRAVFEVVEEAYGHVKVWDPDRQDYVMTNLRFTNPHQPQPNLRVKGRTVGVLPE